MEDSPIGWQETVFLGVQGYGTVRAADKERFRFRFSTDGVERVYAVSNRSQFALQNRLREGEVCRIALCGGIVAAVEPPVNARLGTALDERTVLTSEGIRIDANGIPAERISCFPGGAEVLPAKMKRGDRVCLTVSCGKPRRVYLTETAGTYRPPVWGIPGRRTLKNFLATALEPVGTVLYVYGGGWNWQDDGAGRAAVSLGLSRCWTEFFRRQDAGYSYRNDANFSKSWYPHNGWNEYGWAGLDCSGYVGWTVYNLMHDVPGLPGYVQSASGMARDFARRGWGEWTRKISPETFQPGDIFSMAGHVWICLGVCGDGSLVILHSNPSPSITGNPGGGVQISAVGGGETCEAYRLAASYMRRFYPRWSARYAAVCRPCANYTAVAEDVRAGKFSWSLSGTICDPDGFSHMTADRILRNLFGNRKI